MHLEVLVEEPSAEDALNLLLPKLLGSEHGFTVHPHNGKRQLLAKLPGRLRGYSAWIAASDVAVLVLVDRDRDDCVELKQRLVEVASNAGLALPGDAAGRAAQCVCRIAVEELEAWFFGDPAAVRAAFPKVPGKFADTPKYRNPDAIADAWEALEKVLQKHGYFPNGLQKRAAAAAIAREMVPGRNRSPSFQAFAAAVRRMAASGSGPDDDAAEVLQG